MAEQNQTDVFADFTVTEPSVISNTPINNFQTPKEPDVFSGFTVTEPVKQKTNDVFSGFTVTGDGTKPQLSYQSTEQFTDAQKIRYGIDKQNTFFGNLFRVAKSGTQAAFDPDRSEEHTSELRSRLHLVCRLLLEKKKRSSIHGSTEAPRSIQSSWI